MTMPDVRGAVLRTKGLSNGLSEWIQGKPSMTADKTKTPDSPALPLKESSGQRQLNVIAFQYRCAGTPFHSRRFRHARTPVVLALFVVVTLLFLIASGPSGGAEHSTEVKNTAFHPTTPSVSLCADCPGIVIAVGREASQGFITPIAFYAGSRYHEIRVDFHGDSEKKAIQTQAELIRRVNKFTIVQDGADVGSFLVQTVAHQNSGLGCGEAIVPKGKVLYRSGHDNRPLRKNRDVFLAGLGMPLKNHKDVVAKDIPPDILMGVNALARDMFRKEIKVTSPSNIDFATYRTGPVKAYDINGDKQADYIILEPTAKLHKPVFVEVAGDSNEVSVFMIVYVNAKSLKRIYGVPGFYYSPRYYCVADLDSDGNLEILLEEGFGEAFHFEIYRFSQGFPNLYRGTEFGC